MSSSQTILDIDHSILERNLMITEPDFNPIDTLLPNKPSSEVPSKLVKPAPGFCVKFRTKAEEKIFVNVCHTDALPEPLNITEKELEEILSSNVQSSYRIPMSIGEGRTVSDAHGNPATGYDIAIHTNFLKKLQQSKPFQEFFLAVVLDALENKYNLNLDREKFSILKNKKCMGNLHTHRIEQREINTKMGVPTKSLIEVLDETVVQNTTPETNSPDAETRAPEYRLFRKTKDGNVNLIIGEFKMPEIYNANDVTLDIGEDRVVLEALKYGYLLDFYVPYSLDQHNVKAQLNSETGILTVTMPTVPVA